METITVSIPEGLFVNNEIDWSAWITAAASIISAIAVILAYRASNKATKITEKALIESQSQNAKNRSYNIFITYEKILIKYGQTLKDFKSIINETNMPEEIPLKFKAIFMDFKGDNLTRFLIRCNGEMLHLPFSSKYTSYLKNEVCGDTNIEEVLHILTYIRINIIEVVRIYDNISTIIVSEEFKNMEL